MLRCLCYTQYLNKGKFLETEITGVSKSHSELHIGKVLLKSAALYLLVKYQ